MKKKILIFNKYRSHYGTFYSSNVMILITRIIKKKKAKSRLNEKHKKKPIGHLNK